MDSQEQAKKRLIQATKAYRSAEQALDAARHETIAALIAARIAGVSPTEVEELAPFKSAYIRRITREAGIPPARQGGGGA